MMRISVMLLPYWRLLFLKISHISLFFLWQSLEICPPQMVYSQMVQIATKSKKCRKMFFSGQIFWKISDLIMFRVIDLWFAPFENKYFWEGIFYNTSCSVKVKKASKKGFLLGTIWKNKGLGINGGDRKEEKGI